MKVLIACEESQAVCKEFRALGHEAYSCDIQECSGGHPEWHKQCDALGEAYYGEYDMVIAFPPCTYLSNAGACRLYPKKGQLDMERYAKGLDAKMFFMGFLNCPCERVAVENPVSSRVFEMPQHTQEIQPYMFGHPYTKKTRLWLKGLPPLMATDLVQPVGPYVCGNAEIWKKQAANGRVIGKEKSAKHRSKTFPGIAKAMAEQWGGIA